MHFDYNKYPLKWNHRRIIPTNIHFDLKKRKNRPTAKLLSVKSILAAEKIKKTETTHDFLLDSFTKSNELHACHHCQYPLKTKRQQLFSLKYTFWFVAQFNIHVVVL